MISRLPDVFGIGCCTRPVLAYRSLLSVVLLEQVSPPIEPELLLLSVYFRITLGRDRRLRSRAGGGGALPRGMRLKCTPSAQKRARGCRLLPGPGRDRTELQGPRLDLPMHLLSLWEADVFCLVCRTRSFPHWRRSSPRCGTLTRNWKHCWKSAKRLRSNGVARLVSRFSDAAAFRDRVRFSDLDPARSRANVMRLHILESELRTDAPIGRLSVKASSGWCGRGKSLLVVSDTHEETRYPGYMRCCEEGVRAFALCRDDGDGGWEALGLGACAGRGAGTAFMQRVASQVG